MCTCGLIQKVSRGEVRLVVATSGGSGDKTCIAPPAGEALPLSLSTTETTAHARRLLRKRAQGAETSLDKKSDKAVLESISDFLGEPVSAF